MAAATTDRFTIFIAGLSDLLACAFSMASGEYASVSTQKDTEKSAVAQEEKLLKTDFAGELQAVTDYYVNKEFQGNLCCHRGRPVKEETSRNGRAGQYDIELATT